MTDSDRPLASANDEDRLPWLEAVDDERDEDSGAAGRLVAAVIAALVALGLVIGGVFWVRQRHAPQGQGDLIAAPQGDYKRAPTPAEANSSVEGEGDATYAASQGANVSSTIDTTRIPEAPVTGGVTASDATGSKALPPASAPVALPKAEVPKAETKPKAETAKTATPPKASTAPVPVKTATAAPIKAEPVKAKPAKTAEAEPAKAKANTKPEAKEASTGGASKQIGAYSSQAKADAASSDLTHRFPALRGLSLSVRSGDSKGKTVYRIFMKGPEAKVEAVCRALHSAKEGCIPG